MHIPDGILPASVCIGGYAITGGLTWYSLRQIKHDPLPQENIPKASLLTAAFFVTSLIHVPIPPSSIHFILNGLLGVILGYYAFIAILIGLFFQAVMFQHGGLSTLGINAAMMGSGAIIGYHIFNLRNYIPSKNTLWTAIFSFLAGSLSLFISACIFVAVIITNIAPDLDKNTEKNAIIASIIGYIIQSVIEGVFTAMLVVFIAKIKPDLLLGNRKKVHETNT